MRGGVVLAILAMGSMASAQEEPAPKRREWLPDHQSPDGGWSPRGFEARCVGKPCGGAAEAWESEVAPTGLALLAFVGMGETHKTPRYGSVVGAAARRLKEIQDGDGCFGIRYPERFVADHAIATLAMTELYGLTRSLLFRKPAERAVAFLLSQRGSDGGWRAGDRFIESDAVTTCWAVSALKSAALVGLEIDPEVFRGAIAFLDGITDPETGEALLHRFESAPSVRATAAAVLGRIWCGVLRNDTAVTRGAAVVLRSPPADQDAEHWFLATSACFQVGGNTYKKWNEGMKRGIIESQVLDRESCAWGSWDPVPGPSAGMGRAATTALSILCIEVYYRYARVFGSKGSPPTPVRSISNRTAALDLDFPEPRTGFLR